jgi:HAD superfamily hydrolase (TIGR01484 family)
MRRILAKDAQDVRFSMCKTATMRPRPWAEAMLPRDVAGVFTDIDDTLTKGGAIEPAALSALCALHAANVPVVAITGRPVGWSERFAREWPLAAIVPENGAVALIREGDAVRTEYAQDEAIRRRNAARLREVAAQVLRDVPGAALARDSAGRVTDIAVDHGEFAQLDEASIDRVVALMREAGMTATVSSIHINGWFGEHDKLSGARWMARRLFNRALDATPWVYVGDSTNDQTMFEHFALSVGVANLREFAAQLTTWPAFITDGERGEGFAEVAARVIASKQA